MAEWSYEPDEVKKIKKGTVLRGSWGYDQTNNEYCKVVKNTGKTLICQKLKTILGPRGLGGTPVKPDLKSKECKPFRIKIDRYTYEGEDNVSLRGKMPLGDCEDGIKVHWGKWDGSAQIDTER